jgi:hypothetical protein
MDIKMGPIVYSRNDTNPLKTFATKQFVFVHKLNYILVRHHGNDNGCTARHETGQDNYDYC